jgi:predicted transcriptional regulator
MEVAMNHDRLTQAMEPKLARIQAGVRQFRVAQKLGIPPSVLCEYENGRRPIPAQQRQRILEAIDHLALRGGLERDIDGRF